MIELQIRLEIPSQNASQGRTWRARAAKIKKTRAIWKVKCWYQMVGVCKRATGPRTLHIIAYRKQRCKDIANLIGGAKACIDGLVDAGLLVDDCDEMAKITYEQRVASESPTGKAHTTLQVGEMT